MKQIVRSLALKSLLENPRVFSTMNVLVFSVIITCHRLRTNITNEDNISHTNNNNTTTPDILEEEEVSIRSLGPHVNSVLPGK